MPTYTELYVGDNFQHKILFVHLNYFEGLCILFTLFYIIAATILVVGYRYWPNVFAPIVEPLQDPGQHGRRVQPPGAAAAGGHQPE